MACLKLWISWRVSAMSFVKIREPLFVAKAPWRKTIATDQNVRSLPDSKRVCLSIRWNLCWSSVMSLQRSFQKLLTCSKTEGVPCYPNLYMFEYLVFKGCLQSLVEVEKLLLSLASCVLLNLCIRCLSLVECAEVRAEFFCRWTEPRIIDRIFQSLEQVWYLFLWLHSQ